MKYIYISLIGLLMFVSNVQAQTKSLLDRVQSDFSPSQRRFEEISFDTDGRIERAFYTTPAYYGVLANKSTLVLPVGRRASKSLVMSSYNIGSQTGDFLPSEGNEFMDYGLQAAGELTVKESGTLFGSMGFTQGVHKNIGWSAVRYSDLYAPYITTDSIGGDYTFDKYNVRGGYAFAIKDFFYGISASFVGEQAHRNTDPRALNSTTWLNFNASVGRIFNSHLLMLAFGYERNKQYQTLRYWRPGEQNRFFVSYGFGLYDFNYSRVSFGYSRMYYIDGVSTALSYRSPIKNDFNVEAQIGYKYSKMKSEESDIKDLYFSNTHEFIPLLQFNWQASDCFSMKLLAQSDISSRKGSENIFEQYLVDDVNNVYDFRIIDVQQNYSLTEANSLVQLKSILKLNSSHSLEFLIGAYHKYRSEKYAFDNYKILNSSISPHLGLGYKLLKNRSSLDFSVIYQQKLLLENEYSVYRRSSDYQYLDFQHAFTPYAYRNSTLNSFRVDGVYLYQLPKIGVGVSMKMLLTRGERDKETIFNDEVGFVSTAPSIKVTPDVHDEIWNSYSIFLVF